MENKLVMFDCFGVILSPVIWDWWHKYLPKKDFSLCKKICSDGDIGIHTFYGAAKKIADEYGFNADDVYNEFIANSKANSELVEIIKKLKGKYHVVLVSNAPEGEVETLFNKHDLADCFEHLYISYQYKDVKPNISFYNIALNDYEGMEAVMIDDTKYNLETLPQIGVHTILYKQDNCQLIKDLKEAGFEI